MQDKLTQSWLMLQCQMIPGVRRAMLLLNAGVGLEQSAVWPSSQTDMSGLSEIGSLAARNSEPTVIRPTSKLDSNTSSGPVVIAFPTFRDQVLFGVIVLEVNELEENQQNTLTQLLGWGSAWLQLLYKNNIPQVMITNLAIVIEATSRTVEHSSLRASITDLLSFLARSFSCDRVSYGQLDGHSMQLYALSDSAQLDPRSSLVRRIEAAMDEALDQGITLSYSVLSAKRNSELLAHERLCAGTSQGHAATFLLSSADRAFAALTFERRNGPEFDQNTTDICNALTDLLGPILDLKRLHSRPLIHKVRDGIRHWIAQRIGYKRLRTKLFIMFSCFVALWLAMSNGVHRVNSVAVLEGIDVRELVAPVEGYIKHARVRSGDLIKKGELIAELDERDLQIDYQRVASERDDLLRKHRRAIASQDRAEAAVLEARLGRADAQLSLITEHLERTKIVAPFDGVIISGDLSESIGAPVERGSVLFRIAPPDNYRLALQVNDNDIGFVEKGQLGTLALAAQPGKRLTFTVQEIIGIATVDQGENGFRVEANLEGTEIPLRPGMRGNGKIEIGERSRLWIWIHPVIDRISLWLWSHLP